MAFASRIVVYDNLRRDSLKDKAYNDHPNLTVIQGDVLEFPEAGLMPVRLRRESGNSRPDPSVCLV